jgi:UDP-glucose 4-epimerase
MDSSFFITGIRGFIGANLANTLDRLGYRVSGIDNLSSPSKTVLNSNIRAIEADVIEPDSYCGLLAESTFAVHLAAMSRSANSIGNELFCLEQNVLATERILRACINTGVKRFIYAGSSTYYGSSTIPHSIGSPPNFLNYYGLSKYLGEEVVRRCSEGRIEYNVLRFFNVFGQGQPTSGEYALVFGIFIERAKLGLPLIIHGDGSQTRDFIHVDDVCSAIIRSCLSTPEGKTYNVGSGKNISVKQLADWIEPTNQLYEKRRDGDALHTLADINLTREDLGWEVSKEPVETILKMIKEALG